MYLDLSEVKWSLCSEEVRSTQNAVHNVLMLMYEVRNKKFLMKANGYPNFFETSKTSSSIWLHMPGCSPTTRSAAVGGSSTYSFFDGNPEEWISDTVLCIGEISVNWSLAHRHSCWGWTQTDRFWTFQIARMAFQFIHSFVQSSYIAPFQDTYSEVLPPNHGKREKFLNAFKRACKASGEERTDLKEGYSW